MSSSLTCRFCKTWLDHTVIDLGLSPLSNSYLTQDALKREEKFFPLHVRICEQCYLVQLPEFESPENIFSDYAYFSSYSDSMLKHCQAYTQMMIKRFGINPEWQVVEIASNDGYLLQYFQKENIPVLGIEPAANVAAVALQKGIPTESFFFGKATAEKMRQAGKSASLLIGNNVLAHVPDLNSFVAGLKTLLAHQGIITLEFPHLMRLIEENQFDTIYHEHFSYLSLLTVAKVFQQHQLAIFDVEEVAIHGGSLRIFAKHADNTTQSVSPRVSALLQTEKRFGLDVIDTYHTFANRIHDLKKEVLHFMTETKKSGKTIAGYGAPAKGNTLLNYCAIKSDLLPFTVDRNPHKQNHFLPGSHIPIFHPDKIRETKPDYLFLLPWNIKHEIMEQMSFIREWGGQFVVPIPQLQVI